jgi:DNA-binding MarR family transcriptional regulator
MREECTSFAEKLTSLFSDIIFKTMTVQLLRELDDLDISLPQLQALTYVAEHRNCSVGALAEGLGVTHPAAVKSVDRLVKKGLVARAVAASDHRQAELTATPGGRSLINEIRRQRTHRLTQVLDRMAPEQRHALIRGLESFVTTALMDEGALNGLCLSCQTLMPTDCKDWISEVLPTLAARQILSGG